MHTQTSEIPVQWPINTIIAGGTYMMEDGNVGRVMGLRRTLDNVLLLIMNTSGVDQEVDIMRFDSWTRV